MDNKEFSRRVTTARLKAALVKAPGLTTKDLAAKMEVNREFMAGYLAALAERGEIICRRAGPARIHFAPDSSQEGQG